MVWIKICGITEIREGTCIAGLNPDALGFILSTQSRRKITIGTAEKIIQAVRRKYRQKAPDMAGVFVDEPLDHLIAAIKRLGLNLVQLCGHEQKDYIRKVKQWGGVQVIRAIPCRTGTDISAHMHHLEHVADYFLLDSYSKFAYGGTGRTFDWKMAKKRKKTNKVILAGGLGADNVCAALDAVRPFGVDASSRLEGDNGKKDISKVRMFIEKAKGGDHGQKI